VLCSLCQQADQIDLRQIGVCASACSGFDPGQDHTKKTASLGQGRQTECQRYTYLCSRPLWDHTLKYLIKFSILVREGVWGLIFEFENPPVNAACALLLLFIEEAEAVAEAAAKAVLWILLTPQ